jgi:coenzyme F420 hydrogenase subunit beta
MGFEKVSFEDTLAKNVIAAGKCVGCGACVVVCPFNCLDYQEGQPNLVKECKICGICPKICPVNEWSWEEAEKFVFGEEEKVKKEFGTYRRLVLAQAKNEKILKSCQDGGVATALLSFALENGIIESAVVSGLNPDKPFYPVPKLVSTLEELAECAGTRYTFSPNILALAEGVKQKKKSVAFLGTPCQIHAVRKMQMSGLKKYTKSLKFLVGLMCSECFTYEGLMKKHIHGALGLSLEDIKKINIKGKMLVTTDSDVKAIKLAEIKKYAKNSCKFCDDFSSELADISVGGLGLEGWTFTIIRTEEGEEIFSRAEKEGFLNTKKVDNEERALNLLTKLSRKKRTTVQT